MFISTTWGRTELPGNAAIMAAQVIRFLCKWQYLFTSHDLLNFWNKLQAEFSTFGLDNYAALCRQAVNAIGFVDGFTSSVQIKEFCLESNLF
jgi:hypothetical protein